MNMKQDKSDKDNSKTIVSRPVEKTNPPVIFLAKGNAIQPVWERALNITLNKQKITHVR